jgi:hypothetical protein
MRLAIEFIVSGKDLAEVKDKATAEWRRIMGNENEELPALAEMKLRGNEDGGDLIGYVTVNTKLED